MKGRTVANLRQSSRVMRLASASLIASQLLIAEPLFAQDVTRASVQVATRAADDARRRLAKARVRVNKTVPTVTPPNLEHDLVPTSPRTS